MYLLKTVLDSVTGDNISKTTLNRRDDFDNDVYFGPSAFALIALLILFSCCTAVVVHRRRRQRLAVFHASTLPTHHRSGHHRTLTISTSSDGPRGDSIFVYDEKMNLIANSSSPPSATVPEIHVTFPDETGRDGQNRGGRVVVLRISDTGSVGMEPLHHEQLPPCQRSDAERFQSLDLERIGGLREKTTNEIRSRYS